MRYINLTFEYQTDTFLVYHEIYWLSHWAHIRLLLQTMWQTITHSPPVLTWLPGNTLIWWAEHTLTWQCGPSRSCSPQLEWETSSWNC